MDFSLSPIRKREFFWIGPAFRTNYACSMVQQGQSVRSTAVAGASIALEHRVLLSPFDYAFFSVCILKNGSSFHYWTQRFDVCQTYMQLLI